MKKIAIVQSNYIPWKGYFDLIAGVDEFILFDDMQYTRRDWRNRNIIKTHDGLKWLTIPVEVKNKYDQKINETKVADGKWRKTHFETLCSNYSRTSFFKTYKPFIEGLYLNDSEIMLSMINYRFITGINTILNIKTKISWSSDYTILEGKTERLISLCKQSCASEYISGPSAKGYIDELMFKKEDITLTWMDYSNYPEYPQLNPPFEHAVSILDLIFNCGSDAPMYMKHLNL